MSKNHNKMSRPQGAKFKAILRENTNDPCVLCKRTIDDELVFGNIYTINDISCHYFCVLLSSCAVQHGNDNEGLFGFLYSDIIGEVERGKKNRCSYCNKNGATLGCSVGQCRKQFHLPCGRERNAVSIFNGNFKSFCEKHSPKQNIPANIMTIAKLRKQRWNKKGANKNISDVSDEGNKICVICCENVCGFPSAQTFWPPCCAKDVWFHRLCIQRTALSSGTHYLKCPLCNDKEIFHKAVLTQGFYIPDRDASWELEQNAFNDMYERPTSCGAKECKCHMGRDHDAETGLWDLKYCLLCGSCGMHAGCLEEHTSRYICEACAQVPIPDIDLFEKDLENVRMQEIATNESRRIVMPSRMSLRRTKPIINTSNTSSRNTTTQIAPLSFTEIKPQEELVENETSKIQSPQKSIDNPNSIKKLISPIKRINRELHRQLVDMEGKDINLLMSKIKENSIKPMPMKMKNLIHGLVDKLMSYSNENAKINSEINIVVENNTDEDKLQELDEQKTSENGRRKTSENVQTIECNKIEIGVKMKTIDILNNSSIEFSESNQSVNIDVINVTETENSPKLRANLLKSMPITKKCALKFGPIDNECLENTDRAIDLDAFQMNYLSEINKSDKAKSTKDLSNSDKQKKIKHNNTKIDKCDKISEKDKIISKNNNSTEIDDSLKLNDNNNKEIHNSNESKKTKPNNNKSESNIFSKRAKDDKNEIRKNKIAKSSENDRKIYSIKHNNSTIIDNANIKITEIDKINTKKQNNKLIEINIFDDDDIINNKRQKHKNNSKNIKNSNNSTETELFAKPTKDDEDKIQLNEFEKIIKCNEQIKQNLDKINKIIDKSKQNNLKRKLESDNNIGNKKTKIDKTEKIKIKIRLKKESRKEKRDKKVKKLTQDISPKSFRQTVLNFSPNNESKTAQIVLSPNKNIKRKRKYSISHNCDDQYKQTSLFNYFKVNTNLSPTKQQ